MILTQSKAKISSLLSYPIGAEEISRVLEDSIDTSRWTLSFQESPIWPASAFRKTLATDRPYSILAVQISPAMRPGYSASSDMIARGWYEERRELIVYPVKRTSRHAAHRRLIEEGLPFVGNWLSSPKFGDPLITPMRLGLVFDPAGETLTPEGSNVPD
jgi:hypothetical protein